MTNPPYICPACCLLVARRKQNAKHEEKTDGLPNLVDFTLQSDMTGDSELHDSVAKSSGRVSKHMNDDHGDSLLAYAHFYAGLTSATKASVSKIDSEAMYLDVVVCEGDLCKIKNEVKVPWKPALKNASDMRKSAVAMHKEAFNGLGFVYKVRKGYYNTVVKMIWKHGKGTLIQVGGAIIGGLIGVVGYYMYVNNYHIIKY